MSILTKSAFLSKWNTAFADNSTRQITEADMREFMTDIKDSFLNIQDQAYDGVAGWKTALNTITALKSIASISLSAGVNVAFRDTDNSDVLRVYELVSGTDAEVSPSLIRPNDYDGTTNPKVWKLAVLTSGNIDKGFIGTWDLSTNILPGGTTTYSGNFWKGINGGSLTTLTTLDGSKIPEGAFIMANTNNPRSNNILDWDVWYTIQS